MKILYAIQGTGNGHLSRARDIIPILQQKGDVDILISGTQADVHLPYEIKYRFNGLGFIFGKSGGIDIPATYRKANLKKLFNEIRSLPVEQYDLVINDFEPVSAWACYRANKTCIAISHQSAVLNKHAPQPEHNDMLGRAILKNYAPSDLQVGFHFQPYDTNIFTPVIRKEIREIALQNKKHYTVYLPAYDDERIIKVLSAFKNTEWQVFSKHSKRAYRQGNISIFAIENTAFISSMASAAGVLCGAGFETPAEALFMQKKLLVIPMKGQYEQYCNAAALAQMKVPVIKSLKRKHADKIMAWLKTENRIKVDYPDNTAAVIEQLLLQEEQFAKPALPDSGMSTAKKFRKLVVKKILAQLTR